MRRIFPSAVGCYKRTRRSRRLAFAFYYMHVYLVCDCHSMVMCWQYMFVSDFGCSIVPMLWNLDSVREILWEVVRLDILWDEKHLLAQSATTGFPGLFEKFSTKRINGLSRAWELAVARWNHVVKEEMGRAHKGVWNEKVACHPRTGTT